MKYRTVLFVLLALLLMAGPGQAERRALLIGINNYSPPESQKDNVSCDRKWTNLKGAVNDIEAMAEIITWRCEVPQENIVMLKNEQAGREAILAAIRDHLITPTKPGDELLFYYCGHGSRVPSNDPEEVDGIDETIVPADAWQCEPDILDSELGWLFNDIIDKGGKLTALFDSCHSGSISRGGPMRTAGARSLGSPKSSIALDRPEVPVDDRSSPSKRGALIVSAAQDFQSATEAYGPSGNIHGAFTFTLISTLRESAGNPSASELFSGVRARLRGFQFQQEPHFDSNESRREEPWFGPGSEAEAKGLLVSVIGRDGDKGEEIVLGEGLGLGLSPGCILESRLSDSSYRLEITSVPDLVSSRAKVLGDKSVDIRSGQFVEVVHWEPISDRRFWIPESVDVSLQPIVHEVYGLVLENEMKWLEPGYLESFPAAMIYWKNQSWQLFVDDEGELSLGADPSWAKVLRAVKKDHGVQGVMMLLPPGSELREEIINSNTGSYLTDRSEMAQYFLVRWFDGEEEKLMWVSSRSTGSTSRESGEDSDSFMPVRTISVSNKMKVRNVSRSLVQQIRNLDRLYQWFRMENSLDSSGFPYRLAVQNTASQETVEDGFLSQDIEYEIVMKLALAYPGQDCPKRWIYVFHVDPQGGLGLFYPTSNMTNENNRFPRLGHGGGLPGEVVLEGTSFNINPPWGMDSFVMLTSRVPLDVTTLMKLVNPVETRSAFRPSQWSVGRSSYFTGP